MLPSASFLNISLREVSTGEMDWDRLWLNSGDAPLDQDFLRQRQELPAKCGEAPRDDLAEY